jgi:oligopeptide transport system ATP-binding protein
MSETDANPAVAEPLLRVRDLAVHFPVKRGFWQRRVGTVRAVDGVSFDVAAGTTLGLVGESGCGKSTTGRAILRLVKATSGQVAVAGRDVLGLNGSALRDARRDMQMVFQDPYASLNPRMTVFDTLAEPLRVHRLVKSDAEALPRVRALLDQVGLAGSYLRRYPHEFSGGQRQRIGIARAIALEPKLVVADEPVSALDVSIQAQIVNLLVELQERLGLTYVFVAHDLAVVRHVSEQIAVMYLGRIVERAPTRRVFVDPRHPYTRALLSAIPVPDPTVERARKRIVLSGEVPSPLSPPSGCTFHTRCPHAMDRCKTEVPLLVERAPGHLVACHLEDDPTLAEAAAEQDGARA